MIRLEALFSDAFDPNSQLMRSNPKQATLLATGLLIRGDLRMADVQRNLKRLRPHLRLPYWNPDGIKVGLCATPPVGLPHSILSLSNSCCMADVLDTLIARFDRLYRRKAHMHHFSQFIDAVHLPRAREVLLGVRDQYRALNQATPPPDAQALMDRLVSLG